MAIKDWIIQVDGADQGADLVQDTDPTSRTFNQWIRSAPYPAFWANQSIRLLVLNAPTTAVKVGDSATIQVRLFGGGEKRDAAPVAITDLQAWVCYPCTAASANGEFNAALVVPSMRTAPPTLTIAGGLSFPPDPTDWQSLSPVWTPTADDVLQAPAVDQVAPDTAHTCVLVNSHGYQQGVDVGVWANSATDPVGVNVLKNPHVGQLNMAIVGAPQARKQTGGGSGGDGAGGAFAFLAGVTEAGRRAPLRVTVEHVQQGAQIDPHILALLQASKYGALPLKPSNTPPVLFGLTRNPHALRHPWLCQFFEDIVEELEAILEDLEHILFGRPIASNHPEKAVEVSTSLAGIYPLLLHSRFPAGEPAGSVHVFDIVQTDPATGERGGIRVAMVVTD